MKITNIKIKNYKKLNIEKMDLVPNKNNFVNNGSYFEGNKTVPNLVGIAGANAAGKSSIIEAIRLIKIFQSRNLYMLLAPVIVQNDDVIKYFENSSNKNNTSQFGGFAGTNRFKYMPNFTKVISTPKGYKEFTSSPKIENIMVNASNDFYATIFESNARNKNEDIDIQVEIEDNNKPYVFRITINKLGAQVFIKSSGTETERANAFTKFQNSLVVSSGTARDLAPIKLIDGSHVHIGSDLNQNMQRKELSEKIKSDKRLWAVLKIADQSIDKIYYSAKDNENRVKLKNGSDISIEGLSLGSKKLIELTVDILVAEKLNGILFCDEIENSLNQSIVNALKSFVKSTGIQIFFTSHSGPSLSNGMDNKQIFILDPVFNLEEQKIVSEIWKFSAKFNKNNKFESIYKKGIVASPTINSMSEFLEVVINESRT